MQAFLNKLRRRANTCPLLSDERGLSTVEYVIILVVVAVMAIGVWRTFGEKVQEQVDGARQDIENLREGDTQ